MKKFLSFTLILLLTLTMSTPALAASPGSGSWPFPGSGGSGGIKTEITEPLFLGLTMKVTDANGDEVSAVDGVYTIKADYTVVFTATGLNLNKSDNTYELYYTPDSSSPIRAWTPIGDTGVYRSMEGSRFASCTSEYTITYGKSSSTQKTVATVIYDDGKTEITGVSVGVKNASGSDVADTDGVYTVQPDDSVTLTVSGRNLDSASGTHQIGYADGTTVALTDTSFWTISEDGKSATATLTGSDFSSCTGAYEIRYTADGETWSTSGTSIAFQDWIVYVDISWGALSFVYSDDAGWTCDTDANTVMVRNMGTVSVKADVTFTKSTTATNITNVTGTFDKSTDTLKENCIEIFTLTLAGKPDGALSDAEIGTITVTITKATADS